MTTRPQDFFGASPKTVLAKPFFHCQDQKAYNVDGGSSIADAWTKRDLNTVIHNSIMGASLASNEVSLPAGTYYVEGVAIWGATTAITAHILGVFLGGTLALQGLSYNHITTVNLGEGQYSVSGIITLSTSGVVSLQYYHGLAYAGVGLGRDNGDGSITDPAILSIYADLKIWQLSGSIEYA